MAALPCFDKAPNLVIALPGSFLFSRIADLLDEVCQQADIARLPEQKAIRRDSVPPGTSGLLVILLD